jgi:deoxyribodipyrimidine photo-lyase
VPELAAVPLAYLHEPWRSEGAANLKYPAPIVDHVAAAVAAREALHAVRQRGGHRAAAARIADKHGSRKAGMPMTGQKRGAKAKPVETGQLAFDL